MYFNFKAFYFNVKVLQVCGEGVGTVSGSSRAYQLLLHPTRVALPTLTSPEDCEPHKDVDQQQSGN